MHRIPVHVPLLEEPRRVAVIFVRVESDAGAVGFGVAGPQSQASVVDLLNWEIGPFVVGRNPLLASNLRRRRGSASTRAA